MNYNRTALWGEHLRAGTEAVPRNTADTQQGRASCIAAQSWKKFADGSGCEDQCPANESIIGSAGIASP